jgi:hypothetical protein
MRTDQLGNGVFGVLLVELLRGSVGLDVIQSELYLISCTELLCNLPGLVGVFFL